MTPSVMQRHLVPCGMGGTMLRLLILVSLAALTAAEPFSMGAGVGLARQRRSQWVHHAFEVRATHSPRAVSTRTATTLLRLTMSWPRCHCICRYICVRPMHPSCSSHRC